MNPGSEPERDDTGLPPVDIEIPDDARELDRDVQAYHRELRAHRRRSRSSRLHGLLSRDGVALPLLACCLIFALITGTLLTVFTASGIDQGIPGAPGGKPGASTPAGSPGAPAGAVTGIPTVSKGAVMPAATITVGGVPEPLPDLRSTAVMLVPGNCACSATLAQLAALMTNAGATTLLVAAAGLPRGELAAAQRAGAKLALDSSGALRRRYPHAGLTAVLVAANGTVHYAEGLRPGESMNTLLPAVSELGTGIRHLLT